MNSRKKILFVAGNVEHLYQFVIHGFFKELSETSSIYLTMPERELSDLRWVEMSAHLDGVFTEVLPYKYSAKARKVGYQLGAALTFRYRKFSSGYRGRISNSLLGGLDIPFRLKSFEALLAISKSSKEVLKNVSHELPAMVRGTRPIFWIWSKIRVRQVILGCSLSDVLKSVSPDVSVTIMQRQAGFVIAALESGEKHQIPTLLIPYKWDNASSKSPLIRTPTKMLVYNSAIKEVCTRLHKMSTGAVEAVGSVEIGKGLSGKQFNDQQVVLLIGATADATESEKWLLCLADLFDSEICSNLQKELRLIWRPYPTRDDSNFTFMKSFVSRHPIFELDNDIATGSSHRSGTVSFSEARFAYQRYISMFEKSSVVVSEGTSAIVDARSRGLPVIYPAFRANALIGSQWFHLNRSEHLKALRNTQGVFIAEDEEELKRLVVDFLENPRRIPPDNSGANIFVDERTYAQRVLDVIDDAIAEKSKQRD